MRLSRLCTVSVLALCALAGCASVPKAPEKPIITTTISATIPQKPIDTINNSDVYRLAQDALQPIADQFVEQGDKFLLVQLDSWYGSPAWRFVPTPPTIPSDIFEKHIMPTATSKLAASTSDDRGVNREVDALNGSFQSDSANNVYTLDKDNASNNELLLGRIFMASGYSGIDSFSLAEFAKRNPYFIDSFESGLLSAVMKKQGQGFERLETAGLDSKSITLHGQGKLVFGTDPLDFSTWDDVRRKYDATKLLLYSVNNIINSGMDYIGMQVSFRLVDIAHGGKLLWSGSRTVTSLIFPKKKVPFLGGLHLTLPAPVATILQRDIFAQTLKAKGIVMPINAVLLKVDDIPVFGTYPVTREDFVIEDAIQGLFSIPGVNVVEKLRKRLYKQPWQISHSVHYIDPLLGGDYAEFQDFYGARYMIAYRVLWRNIQGVQLLQGQSDLELADKILGIYVKVLDMGDSGKTILSDFLPFTTENYLNQNILYRCYNAAKGLSAVAKAMKDSGIVGAGTNIMLVNRRMEIANIYAKEDASTGNLNVDRMPQGDVPALFRSYYDAYEVIRRLGLPASNGNSTVGQEGQGTSASANQTYNKAQQINLSMAVNLMQSWFEDGLCTALSDAGIAPNEKMDSLHSRFFLTSRGSVTGTAEDLPFLSPLLLAKWGPIMKSYYNVDKIVYFAFMETATPSSHFLQTPSNIALARYFPFITSEPDSLQVSVVNMTSGVYELKKDFAVR